MSKKTLLKGVLISSFGIFVSKFLGLFYVIPLNALAGEANISFYSIAYTFYGLILSVCNAGVPFAIASLVAKYIANDDYQTANLVKKVGASFVLGLSFIVAIFFLFSINYLSHYSLGKSATIQDIKYLQHCYLLLAIAIITVPFLSAFRGFYQGLKEMEIYTASEIIEQFVRVISIIILGYLFVRILNFPSIYAVYMAIFSASIGAIIALFFLFIQTRKVNKEFKEKLFISEKTSKTKKEIFKELIYLGLPFISASVLGTIGVLINTNFFIPFATSNGIDYETSKIILGIYQVNVSKIISIPTVLTIGYSTGLVPYLTEVYETKNYEGLKNHILEIIDSINFLIIPISFIFIRFAKPIYFIFFGDTNLSLGQSLLANEGLVIYFQTLSLIVSSILLTLRLKKQIIISLIISLFAKFIFFVALLKMIGYLGLNYSSLIYYAIPFIYGLFLISKIYGLNYKKSFYKALILILISFTMNAGYFFLQTIGFNFTYTKRIYDMFVLGIYGFVGLIIFILVSWNLNIPQNIFHKDFNDIKKLFKRS